MDRDYVYQVSRDPTEEHRGADKEAETSSLHIWNPAETSTHQPCFNKHSKIITFIIKRAKSNGGSCARVRACHPDEGSKIAAQSHELLLPFFLRTAAVGT